MDVKRIWRKEAAKRQANDARKERVNRNWPIHADRAVAVFTEFAEEAKKANVYLYVAEPEWFEKSNELLGKRIGEFPIGSTTVSLRFGMQRTEEDLLVRTEDGERVEFGYETGAELVIHHSPTHGVVQVFFRAPYIKPSEPAESLLFTHTYNTDVLTDEWIASLLPNFLAFNRFESSLEHPTIFDSMKVRWWRFRDIRNRRGYLEKFQHLLTPWELLLLGAVLAIPGLATIQWVWGKL